MKKRSELYASKCSKRRRTKRLTPRQKVALRSKYYNRQRTLIRKTGCKRSNPTCGFGTVDKDFFESE